MWRLVIGVLGMVACGRDPMVDRDGDGWVARVDCDDANASINPGQAEIPADGLDNDCNVNTRDDDLDQDGVLPPLDCEPEDPFVPSSFEIPYDGVDNDCNVFTPDDDLDGDGYGFAEDCADDDPERSPGHVEIPYDGVDNDCDPSTPDDDLDGDGSGAEEDCDDGDGAWSDPVLWYVDCDGDGYALAGSSPVEACVPPSAPCFGGAGGWTSLDPAEEADCDDGEARAYPGQTSYFTDPGGPPARPYDFDCDGVQLPDYGLFSCIPVPSTSSCYATPGYAVSPSCGATLSFAEDCVYEGPTSCSMANPVLRTVGCR